MQRIYPQRVVTTGPAPLFEHHDWLADLSAVPVASPDLIGAQLIVALPLPGAQYHTLAFFADGTVVKLALSTQGVWQHLLKQTRVDDLTLNAVTQTIAGQRFAEGGAAKLLVTPPPLIVYLNRYYLSLGGTGKRGNPAILAGSAVSREDTHDAGHFEFDFGCGRSRWTLELVFGRMHPEVLHATMAFGQEVLTFQQHQMGPELLNFTAPALRRVPAAVLLEPPAMQRTVPWLVQQRKTDLTRLIHSETGVVLSPPAVARLTRGLIHTVLTL